MLVVMATHYWIKFLEAHGCKYVRSKASHINLELSKFIIPNKIDGVNPCSIKFYWWRKF